VQRRREVTPAVVLGVVAMLPGVAIPGMLVWWALLGVPAFFAARAAARRRIEREGAERHGVTPAQYRAILQAFDEAIAANQGDFGAVARALQSEPAIVGRGPAPRSLPEASPD
jgi:hypothetical protein